MIKTVIVIPIYRHVEGTERQSLEQCMRVLGAHDIVVVHPEKLDLTDDLRQYPDVRLLPLRNEWFAGVEGYNSMMLSTEFYRLFTDYDYMLIYQLDAYVFSDQLDYWASLDYDYIGAPWTFHVGLFHATIGRFVRWMRRTLQPAGWEGRVKNCHIAGQVGNGGFSLRRISKMEEMTRLYAHHIAKLHFGEKRAQEDVFFALVAGRKAGLKVPKRKEAMRFAWESHPDCCMRKMGRLPFGCHAWQLDKHIGFWMNHIQ